MSRRGRTVVLAWCVALATGLAVFHALGAGALAAPPLDPTGWPAWAEGRDPLVATVALLRLAVLGLGWYLLAVTVLGVVARTVRSARVAGVVDAITVPAVRRFLHGALGVSVATAIVAAAPAVTGQAARAYAASSDGEPTSVMDVLPLPVVDEPGTDVVEDLPEAFLPLPLELLLGDAAPEGGAAMGADAPASDGADDGSGTGEGSGAGPGEAAADASGIEHATTRAADTDAGASQVITVMPGDSLWSIARSALTAGGRDVGDAEVAHYWRDIVERNRGGLADPDNPDLIFPGDVVVLPDLPEREEADR